MSLDLPETLLSSSTIWLFGRVMEDIQLKAPTERANVLRQNSTGGPLNRRSASSFVAKQLLSADAELARIYEFVYMNERFKLSVPAVFVVNGPGIDANGVTDQAGSTAGPGLTGLISQSETFAPDTRIWVYDRDDFSMRLDVTTGTFDRILLDAELSEDGLQSFVRGGGDLGQPSPLGSGGRARRVLRRWRRDED